MAHKQEMHETTPRRWAKNGWFGSNLGQVEYPLLVFAAACQIATVIITWPLWQVRTDPPHMPLVDFPQIPFGMLMIGSCLLSMVRPRFGVLVHAVVLIIASLFDQFRAQPQLFAICLLMFAMSWQTVAFYARWILAALWFWAGLHKLLSPQWWGSTSWWLLSRVTEDADEAHLLFAAVIALGELALGVAAVFWPKWATWYCLALHAGIILFLSPIMIAWNYSVLPWNLATGVVGAYIMWWVAAQRGRSSKEAEPKPKKERRAKRKQQRDSSRIGRIEIAFAIAMFLLPMGFYRSWIDHGFAHVLYSGMLPKAIVTTDEGYYEISGWGELAVPFPSERRLYLLYFKQVAKPGDKLNVSDPRTGLDDLYYQCRDDGQIVPISKLEFYRGTESEFHGVGYDRPLAIFNLTKAGATMLRRKDRGIIYAVKFSPSQFERKHLRYLDGLPNIEEVQLSGTNVQDEDLKYLASLARLRGVGLKETEISDEGLRHLDSLPELRKVDWQGSQITEQGLNSIGLYRVKSKDKE